jgi:hypothetical protein
MRSLVPRRAGDRGSVTVISVAIVFPIVLTLILAAFQAAMWFSARTAALGAAQEGVDAARGRGSSLGAGQAAACAFARTAGHGILRGPACTASGGNTITITVCGSALQLLPGIPLRACEQAQGARERFTTAGRP